MAAEVLELDGLALRIGAGQRLIGADLGAKTIGLALSDVERRIATPLETIRRTKFAKDAARLVTLMVKFDAAALLIAKALEAHTAALADYETEKVVFDAHKDAIEGRIKEAAKKPGASSCRFCG